MRLLATLLGLLAAILAVLLAAALLPEPPGAAGQPHAAFATMRHGGPAAERTGWVLGLGWALGALTIATFATAFALGIRGREGLGPLRRPIVAGALLYEICWIAVVSSYRAYAGDPDVPILWGFPLPTALMLYLLWPFPLLFGLLWVRAFDGTVLDDDALARFRARLDARRRQTTQGEPPRGPAP